MKRDGVTICFNTTGLLAILLTVAFVVLKLVGVGVVAGWSWFWVLSPIIFDAGLFIIILIIAIIAGLCAFNNKNGGGGIDF